MTLGIRMLLACVSVCVCVCVSCLTTQYTIFAKAVKGMDVIHSESSHSLFCVCVRACVCVRVCVCVCLCVCFSHHRYVCHHPCTRRARRSAHTS